MEEEIEKDYWEEWDEGGSDEDFESPLLTKRKDKLISGSVNKPRPLSEND